MRLKQFDRLLDIHGPDLARWPARRQAAARRLIAEDPAARAAQAAACRLGALLDRVPAPPGDAAGRVARLLARLPTQRAPAWWGAPVLLWDLLPRWPRAAALATMAALGIVVGLSDIGVAPLLGTSAATAGAAASSADISGLIFDPNPAIGLGR